MSRRLLAAALVCLVTEGDARAAEAEPLLDLRASVQKVTPETCRLQLHLDALAPQKGGTGRVTARVARHGGAWHPGTAQVHRSPKPEHDADASGLHLSAARLGGTLVVTQTPRRGGEPTVLACRLDATVRPVASDARWPKDSIDIRTFPYYWLYPKQGGAVWEIHGTYQTERGGETVTGEVSGFAAPPPKPGGWTAGTWDDGLRLEFDLGRQRRNWNYGRLALLEFPEPRDLSGAAALRLRVRPDRPRTDCELSVWLREADGSWYRVKSAVPLAAEVNEAVVPLADFADAGVTAPEATLDENQWLDPEAITHIGLGIVNSFGIGKVGLVVETLDLVPAAPPEPPEPAEVVVTGRTLSVSGHPFVPPGLFAGYADPFPTSVRPGCYRGFAGGPSRPPSGSTEAFRIDIWYDRFASALPLHQRDWAEGLARRARAYARRAREGGFVPHLEFWNEPYLNWARTRKNFKRDFFERGPAGGVVVKANGWKVPHFGWEGNRVVDLTQHTYYSARGNGAVYDAMLLALAKAIKDENPAVQVLVSWGFRWKADHWGGWDLEYLPSLERCLPWVDGATEHHYGGDPTALAGMYEVLAAYGVTRAGKWLYSYNTETGDLTRIPVHGRVDTDEKAANLTQYRKALYNVRDIVYHVKESPDKLRSRTLLTWRSQDPEAMPVAYGLLRDLRGRLILAECPDPDLWCVASLDGTDPDAMPPQGGRRLVTVLYNEHPMPREARVTLRAPAGMTLAGGEALTIPRDDATFAFRLAREPLDAAGDAHDVTVTIPAKSVWAAAIELDGPPPAAAEVRRHQAFAPDLLQEVTPDAPLRTTVRLDPARLAVARRAWLRLVLEDVMRGEGTVTVGGTAFPLPPAVTLECANRTVMVPVDVARLRPETDLTFRVEPGGFAGYRVDVTSVVLEEAGAAPAGKLETAALGDR